ncbi:hypothetical protein WR25_27124 [Diploscapter pachys]|uniref:Uncharacterized protein n=1 Tax=Diploscapter pachys TaxID=2018661 RepID=A0A2A2KDH4_9BILA|nr:hypothetical protein WR25_27124 [Diploscapter pachys]
MFLGLQSGPIQSRQALRRRIKACAISPSGTAANPSTSPALVSAALLRRLALPPAPVHPRANRPSAHSCGPAPPGAYGGYAAGNALGP